MGIAHLRRSLTAISAQLAALPRTDRADDCPDAGVLWCRVYGHDPDPWQQEVLTHGHPRVLINGCRQSGKSSVSAALALFEALYRPPALVLLVSASLRQAQELGKKVFDGFGALGKPVSAEAENRLSLELSNGSRVVCLPATEGTIRGMSGARLIVIDEASRVPDPLYHAVRPMLAVSGGRLLAISTPWGKRGWWFEAWHQGAEWHRIQITARECPRISPNFLEEERRSLPGWVFDQEYLCVFGETLDHVFRYEDIAAVMAADVAPLFATGAVSGDGFLISDVFSRS